MSTRPGVTKNSLISSLVPLTADERHARAEAQRFVDGILLSCALAAKDDEPVTERVPRVRADHVHDDLFV